MEEEKDKLADSKEEKDAEEKANTKKKAEAE